MSIEGWYYLHENKQLIYKRDLGDTAADIRDSPFAVALWPFDPTDREGAWNIVVESLAAGAEESRVIQLAEQWGCNDQDAKIYADRIGVIISKDGDQWCATRKDFISLQESKAGFGKTILEALVQLAKALGYHPGKMWGPKFKDLLA